ncbi:MAG: 4-alpha-glucanotransferase [Candidatus Sulfotelmatobacter sp.]
MPVSFALIQRLDQFLNFGWWTSSGIGESIRTAEDIHKEREFTRAYLGFQNEWVNWVFIRAFLASVAEVSIVPLQDVLGLGTANEFTGQGDGKWKWRFTSDALTKDSGARLRRLTLSL